MCSTTHVVQEDVKKSLTGRTELSILDAFVLHAFVQLWHEAAVWAQMGSTDS